MIVYCTYLCPSYINVIQATMVKSTDNILHWSVENTLRIQICPYAELLLPEDTYTEKKYYQI